VRREASAKLKHSVGSENASPRAAGNVRAVTERPVAVTQSDPVRSIPGLGWWNAYFLGKLALYWYGVIGLHPLENLAFALVLLVPMGARGLVYVRTLIAIPVGVALAYYDSWLPPFERLLAQSSQVATFSLPYMIEIAGRFVNGSALLMVLAAAAAYAVAAQLLRVGVVVITLLALLAVAEHAPRQPADQSAAISGSEQKQATSGAILPAADPETDLSTLLTSHFAAESGRQVQFKPQAAGAIPFDLVLLHICSLSWDDLKVMGLEQHPLFSRFDILLTRFNAAASYSGPAAIRLLRAPCGQSDHTGLYSPTQESCYLLPALRKAGFESELVMNHDGHFDDFLGVVRSQGAQGIKPMSITGLPIPQRGFDGSPIFDDAAVLARWAESRASAPATRVVAVYNTISLHDGNQLTGQPGRRSSMDTYRVRLVKLLDDLEQFIVRMETGGRRMVIALVPEHGAAIRGDKMQIAGMREIPTPAITLVPVGIKVIGPGAQRKGAPVQRNEPTSHLALAHILSRMLEQSPFDRPAFQADDYTAALPVTRFVAENAGMVIMERGARYFLRMPKAGWSEYSAPPITLTRSSP
jgi:cellulose synthase operon protein YhjU